MISTRNLARLPHAASLMRVMQSLAMLDSILEEEWEYRYFSFNSKWSETEQMGSMRNGLGDDLFAVFDSFGCFLRGFSHESVMSPWRESGTGVWPGVLDAVPHEFERSRNESAFHMEDTTFCIWQLAAGGNWQHGPIEFPNGSDPDGSEWMLSLLDGNPATYQTFAKEYFEADIPLEVITRVFAHEPLSSNLLQRFPQTRDAQDIIADANEIGYLVALR